MVGEKLEGKERRRGEVQREREQKTPIQIQDTRYNLIFMHAVLDYCIE